MANLTRALASTGLVSGIYYTGDNSNYKNDFDGKKPWSDIKEVTDDYGNVWIRIPKFYTKYVLGTTSNGQSYIKERYISEFNGGTGWHLNPVFKNKSGREIDEIYVSKYFIHAESGRAYSKAGYAPYTGATAATARALIDAYDAIDSFGYEYSSFDIWTAIALQDLSIVEFANNSLRNVMQGITYDTYYTNGLSTTGATDNIGTSTASGINSAADNDTGSVAMKYRGIENVWGGGRLFVDGICFKYGELYVNNDASNYGNHGSYSKVNMVPISSSGLVHQLGFDPKTLVVYPVTIKESGASYGEYCNGANKNDKLQICYLGAESNNGKQIGLNSYLFSSTSGTPSRSVFRMVRKPE